MHNSKHVFCFTAEIIEFDKEYKDILIVHERQLVSAEFNNLSTVNYFWK